MLNLNGVRYRHHPWRWRCSRITFKVYPVVHFTAYGYGALAARVRSHPDKGDMFPTMKRLVYLGAVRIIQ
ncbi:hypothetical protein M434DRAFT_399005 [Hypoxylon sp. CO27-5]|nr:hypothetical protein M434DRAFT_399005 [Hypoxylon sp. CO27-5]